MLPKQSSTAVRRIPWLTWFLIGFHLLVFSWLLSLAPAARPFVLAEWGVVPLREVADAFGWQSITAVWRSLFLVGSVPLFILNLVTLYLLGPVVEDRLGRVPFLILYLAGGYLALLLQMLGESSAPWPVVGNSGAVAALAGAFLLLFPTTRLSAIPPLNYFDGLAAVPAVLLIPLWYVGQLLGVFSWMGVTVGVSLIVTLLALLVTFLVGLLIAWLALQIWPHLRPEVAAQRSPYTL
jgi:membrane associated rhomboid family serine protease